ncbi:MAG: hypothetical protein COT85_05255 [Chlamydiae bacterium CG10_big_fil_rev_8_21_14_0_10_42_34]|nr:MAG: hypothetical protein COT85_05255 [Chlamydiae bacterium CG10_big_fil_rev_8_21_14_0_10_42_34]
MYNLPRQSVPAEIIKIISREWKNKDLGIQSITKENLREIETVCRQIEESVIPKQFVKKKLPGKIGHGIFLHPKAEPILRDQVIAPYSGTFTIVPQNEQDHADYAFDPVTDLHLTKEEQKKYDPKRRFHPKRLYSIKLDASKVGNFTRFINHSEKPNVIAYLVSSKKNPYEIIYFAKKKINPGEQLLVSYENEENSYWGPLGIKPFAMTPKTFRIDSSLKIYTDL